jgi:hypothetical protein
MLAAGGDHRPWSDVRHVDIEHFRLEIADIALSAGSDRSVRPDRIWLKTDQT